MNLSKQILYYRKRDNLSQEELAEKIYVSRQSISNWEREYSYPDIQSLLLLSVLFNVSLDELVKGDVKVMKEKLQGSNLLRWSYAMVALMIMVPVSVAPAMYFLGHYGFVLSMVLFIVLIFSAMKIEKMKKEHNLKTYRQIVNFIEGKPVNKVKPSKKDNLIKVALIFASALISFILVYLGMSVFGL